jgi:hypothetical protein
VKTAGSKAERRKLLRCGRRLAAFTLIAMASAALTACPYSNDLPLSSPSEAVVDSSLPGRWKMQDPDTGQWVTMELMRFSEREYVAWSREPSEAKEKVVLYRLFVTPIENERFLNIQELGRGVGRSWSFARYRLSGDALSLRFLDDSLFSSQAFGSSDALREFVLANLHDPRLYAGNDGTDSIMQWQRVDD